VIEFQIRVVNSIKPLLIGNCVNPMHWRLLVPDEGCGIRVKFLEFILFIYSESVMIQMEGDQWIYERRVFKTEDEFLRKVRKHVLFFILLGKKL